VSRLVLTEVSRRFGGVTAVDRFSLTLQAGDRKLVRWITGGSSYLSSHDRRVLFGLGKAAPEPLELQIRWPSGRLEKFDNLTVDKIHTLKEGSGISAKPAPRK